MAAVDGRYRVDGGYDVNVRSLAAAGVGVTGRAVGTTGGSVVFDDSANTLLNATDKAYTDFVSLARELAAGEVGEELTEDDNTEANPTPARIEPLRSIDLARIQVDRSSGRPATHTTTNGCICR